MSLPDGVRSDGTVTSEHVDGGVAVITIDRPQVRNAMDWSVFDSLRAAAEAVDRSHDVGAVVVTGAAGTFSSGLDTSLFAADGPTIHAAAIAGLQDAFNVFEDLSVPTVAAIAGPCIGAGAQLAAACHLRLVADDAVMAIAERRWGLVPDLGGTYRLPRLVGLGRATDWVMTGRMVDADEAITSGFAQGRFDTFDDVVAVARDLAAAPGATRRVARLLRENLDRGRDAALAAEAAAQLACLSGADVAEAARAAREGRSPRFVGS